MTLPADRVDTRRVTGARAPARPGPRVGARDIARAIDPERMPTSEQQAMIEASFTPLLVVAGAGAGKTETMSQRVLYAVANEEAAPSQVLGLTFTRKAAGELSERVRHRLRSLRGSGLWRPGPPVAAPGAGVAEAAHDVIEAVSPIEADRPHITTYNAFAADIVAEFALRLGEDPGAALMTEARRWQLAESVVLGRRENLDVDRSLSSVIGAVLALSGALDEHLVTPAEAAGQLESLAEDFHIEKAGVASDVEVSLRERAALMEVVADFRARAREEGLVDFGGQVALATRLAREIPDVRQLLRERHPVVMLDEYQDTSVAQVELLSALFGDGHAVTAVGDPQQAIYGWRGASAGAMAQFHTRFRSAGHHPATLTMSTSWRNDAAVLALANNVAGPIPPGSALPPNPLEPRPGAGPGMVLHHRAEDRAAEAEAIAQWLAGSWAPQVDAARDAGVPDARVASAAILCRARSHFPFLTRALDLHDIPYRVVGRGGLLEHRDVADVRAALTVVARPDRGDAAMHLLHRARLGAKDLVALHEYATDLARLSIREVGGEHLRARDEATLVEAMSRPISPSWEARNGEGFSAAGLQRLSALRQVLDDLRRHRNLPLGELVSLTERRLGLDVEAAARPAGQGGRAALDAFTAEAVRFAGDAPEASLSTFLSWLEQLEKSERVDMPEEDVSQVRDAVLIMTVHAAKGLEWDHVAVPGMDEGRLPGYEGKPDPELGRVKDSAWLKSITALPYPMRGDAGDLPRFGIDTESIPTGDFATKKDHDAVVDEYRLACGRHTVGEERHVAYVAVTRARRSLLLTSTRETSYGLERPASRFVPREETGLLREFPAAPPPAPTEDEAEGAAWPAELLAPERRAAVEAVAAQVRELTAGAQDDDADPRSRAGRAGAAGPRPGDPEEVRVRWEEARLLLAERDDRAREAAEGRGEPLPEKLTVTTLVRATADPDDVARDLLRPVPREPSYVVTRGTSLHAWIEQHFVAPALRSREDESDLLDAPDVTETGDVQRLQRAFLNSPWAQRVPVGIEVDLTEVVDGRVVPGVADAVFDDEQGCAVVDWKTGRRPSGRARAARDVQLHMYRLAWSRRTGRPIQEIGGYFVHLDAASGTSGADEVERLGENEVLTLARRALRELSRSAEDVAREQRAAGDLREAEPTPQSRVSSGAGRPDAPRPGPASR